MNIGAIQRAQDAFDTLARLYGEANAQLLMRTRGACCPRVARLAMALLKSQAAIKAAHDYMALASLHAGYYRLMAACRDNRQIRALMSVASHGQRFSSWEIDRAMSIIIMLTERKEASSCPSYCTCSS